MPTPTHSLAVAASTASGGGVIIWIFDCIKQGVLIVPDSTTAGLMAAFIFPILHVFRDIIMVSLGKFTKGDETV